MSSNLTNVYAYLRRTFEDDMIFSKPISYIKTLAGVHRNEKVVIIFKEVNRILIKFISLSITEMFLK